MEAHVPVSGVWINRVAFLDHDARDSGLVVKCASQIHAHKRMCQDALEMMMMVVVVYVVELAFLRP